MLFIDYCSPVAWQLSLTRPKTQREAGGNEGNSLEIDAGDEDLSVLIFHSLVSSDKTVSANFNKLSATNYVFLFLCILINLF